MSTTVSSQITNPVSGDILPTNDDTFDIGSSAKRFQDVYASNGVTQTSDGALKTDVEPSNLGLDFVCSLNPVSYRWLDGKRRHYGFIAQEVREATKDQDFAGYVWDGRAGLRYNEFLSPIVKAIQELNKKVDEMGVVTKEVEIVVEKPVFKVKEVVTEIEKPEFVVRVDSREVSKPDYQIVVSPETVIKPLYEITETTLPVKKPAFKVEEVSEIVVKPVVQVREESVVIEKPSLFSKPNLFNIITVGLVLADVVFRLVKG